jgi:hypothetical protein
LPTTKALIFKRGVKPILADRFDYRSDVRFERWKELKPPAENDRIEQGPACDAPVEAAPEPTIEAEMRELPSHLRSDSE